MKTKTGNEEKNVTTGKQLTVQNATVTTATIEVKTLTIGARQVTQGIFKQLIEEPLTAEDGTLNGVPWGHVTWHPDKCGDDSDHWHVVWQSGQNLRRSQIDKTPRFDRLPMNFECADYEAWEMARIAHRLSVGDTITLFKRRSLDSLDPREEVHNLVYLSASRVREVEGVPVAFTLSDAAHEAALSRHLLRRFEQGGRGIGGDTWQDQERRRLTQRDAEALVNLQGSLSGIDSEQLHAAALTAIRAESARRQRHRELRTTLAQLPQLFIGG